jgi:hypothetical protein
MRELQPCGTVGACKRHLRRGEEPCTPCVNARKAYLAAYHLANKKKHNARDRSRAAEDPEVGRQRIKAWRLANPTAARGWAKAHPEAVVRHVRDAKHKRLARINKAGSTPYTRNQVIDTYGADCHICGEPIDFDAPRWPDSTNRWHKGLHIDHVLAIVHGGQDCLENVRPSHALCNIQKGTLTLK